MWAVRDAEARAEREERNEYALGDAPAPVLNLTAMETLGYVEAELLALADVIANACQLAPRFIGPGAESSIDFVAAHNSDPRRWHYNASWSKGAHWAAVYVDGRLADDDLDAGHFRRMPDRTRHEAADVVRECWRQTAAVLGIGERHVPIPDRPCPGCGGVLMLHQVVDESPAVSCETGRDCTAPVERDIRGRAWWDWRHLGALAGALDARERGAA
ncbi:hypothetical protein [Streptacidiphilus pinicola]|uniref:hypothetical protein n=1 Tax=Streptacidiphilus pinicola TaxID=2219663 RepID=UPI00140409F2|nr:hypothetical protein [Streptacidiphilus pinicola]